MRSDSGEATKDMPVKSKNRSKMLRYRTLQNSKKNEPRKAIVATFKK